MWLGSEASIKQAFPRPAYLGGIPIDNQKVSKRISLHALIDITIKPQRVLEAMFY